MAFDFDDLDEQLPAWEPGVQAMDDATFANLGARLPALFDAARQAGESAALAAALDVEVGGALWGAAGPETAGTRMAQLVKDFAALLVELVRVQTPACACIPLVRVLYGLAVGRGQGEVIVRAPAKSTLPTALIMGHAGSCVKDLNHWIDVYHSLSFGTVAFTPCAFPKVIREYQQVQLASELRALLARGSEASNKLVVHLCGPFAHSAWCCLAESWHQQERPFDSLPRLSDCLGAILWECGPFCSSTEAALAPQDARGASTNGSGNSISENSSASGRKAAELSLEDALSLQRDLQERFSSDAFQDRLGNLESSMPKGSDLFVSERNALFLEAQIPVLEKYGFEGSQRGVVKMLQAGSRWNDNEKYQQNRELLNDLLGLNFEGQKERVRRLELAKRELAASKQESQSGIGSSSGSFGMAALSEDCFRSLWMNHATGLDYTELLHQYIGLGPLIRGVASETQGGEPNWSVHASFEAWITLEVSGNLKHVPRLFLSSETDAKVPIADIDRFIAVIKACHPDCVIAAERIPKAPHMQLWESDRSACLRALTKMLQRARLLDT
eukprot:TRINITY_DN89108_c0_g1_i1.p1 TRINITY_DN89108_c0_g1~~TRINITY_DN89108_c0_g1_i1.p1  ORF type:complete len:559 (+),score=85.77 TRINITY_DN89108_c0_g1_i1:191-1867(+)